MLSNKEIEQWVMYALDCCGRRELFPILEFNYRHNMTKNLGTARYSSNWGRPRGIIALSRDWFKVLPEQEKIDTVIHEVCHIVTDVDLLNSSGRSAYEWSIAMRENRRKKGHCRLWASYMDKCGLPSRSCYVGDVKLETLTPGYCLCKEWKLTKQRAGRIRNGTNSYFCRVCKGTITLKPKLAMSVCQGK